MLNYKGKLIPTIQCEITLYQVPFKTFSFSRFSDILKLLGRELLEVHGKNTLHVYSLCMISIEMYLPHKMALSLLSKYQKMKTSFLSQDLQILPKPRNCQVRSNISLRSGQYKLQTQRLKAIFSSPTPGLFPVWTFKGVSWAYLYVVFYKSVFTNQFFPILHNHLTHSFY